MLVRQLFSQPPTHANVTEVIDHSAKNIASNRFIHSIRMCIYNALKFSM
ncbi:hypothetical protein NTGM5_60089 [Candidatus Nitrotoga sp. M5]|nr:hypothetical protein NTGM5_60089 [Candidatus Nitrotoga sp. M5]